MADEQLSRKMKAWCGQCRGERNCEMMGLHKERGEDGDGYYQWFRTWYLLVCCGCEHTFAQTVSGNSEDYDNSYGPDGETVTTYHETVKTWPAKAKRERPEWFDGDSVNSELASSQLDASLREVYGALDGDLNVLASIGMRTAFDVAAEDLGVDPTKSFEKKTEDLVNRNFIKEMEKEHIDVLVDAGNASAHRGWRPKVSDLDALMDTLEEFIFNSMVLPSRKKLAAEKMAKLKSKVPPRTQKPRKRKL